ncbi:MAG: hypothetical protein GC181_14210 [Bacteroidetes bacterium]|nr:hypothetical protein [Bacteroidota bacterium]
MKTNIRFTGFATIVLVTTAIGFTSCKSRKNTTTQTATEEKTTSTTTTGSTSPTGTNPNAPTADAAVMATGKNLYESKCTKCHTLKDPKNYTAEQLNNIVPKMVAKVNKESTVISESDQNAMLQYLISASKG